MPGGPQHAANDAGAWWSGELCGRRWLYSNWQCVASALACRSAWRIFAARGSSRNLLLKVSAKPFCEGLPGWIGKMIFLTLLFLFDYSSPCAWTHADGIGRGRCARILLSINGPAILGRISERCSTLF